MSLEVKCTISYEEIIKAFETFKTTLEPEQEPISNKVAALLEKMKAKAATVAMPEDRCVGCNVTLEDEKDEKDDEEKTEKDEKDEIKCYKIGLNGNIDCFCGSTLLDLKNLNRHVKSRKHKHWELEKKIEIKK